MEYTGINNLVIVCSNLFNSEGDISKALQSIDFQVFYKCELKCKDNNVTDLYYEKLESLFMEIGYGFKNLISDIGKNLFVYGNCTLLRKYEDGKMTNLKWIPTNYSYSSYFDFCKNLPEDYDILQIKNNETFSDGFGIPTIFPALDTYLTLQNIYLSNMNEISKLISEPYTTSMNKQKYLFKVHKSIHDKLVDELGFFIVKDDIPNIKSETKDNIVKNTIDKFNDNFLKVIQKDYNLSELPDVIIK